MRQLLQLLILVSFFFVQSKTLGQPVPLRILDQPVPLKERFSITVRGDYVAAGVGFSDQDQGTILLSLPEQATIVKAFLYWSVIDVAEFPEMGMATFNGKSAQGNLIASTQSCTGGESKIFNFRADVTEIAAKGENTVSVAPSSSPTLIRRGATLVMIFREQDAAYREVVIWDGDLSFASTGLPEKQSSKLEFSRALVGAQPEGNSIKTTWVVSDGQPTVFQDLQRLQSNNAILVNDVEIADHVLQGDVSGGPFWDTRTDNIGDIVLSGEQPRFGPTYATLSIESRPGTPIRGSGDPFRPGDCITWVAQVLSVSTKAPPVIVIPGIGASVLLPPSEIDPGNNGWPLDVLKTLIGEPEHLQFQEANEIPRTDNISSFLFPQCCAFQSTQSPQFVSLLGEVPKLISFLDNEYKAQENQIVTSFRHDFRFSVSHNAFARTGPVIINPSDPMVGKRIAPSLQDVVQDAMSRTGSRKVDLVAHSRGGLVAKEYLNLHPRDVRTLIMIGTPNLGAPKALKILRYGDDLDVSVMGGLVRPVDACKVKRAAHNFNGVFNMLPGRRYFDEVGGYFWDQADIDATGSRGLIADFEEMNFNLKNGIEHVCPLDKDDDVGPFNRLSSPILEDQFISFHQSRDNWQKPDGTEVYMIAGYNKSTMNGIVEFIRNNRHELQLMEGTGDGTVPLASAIGVDATERYLADMLALNAGHDPMLGNPEVQKQVLGLLRSGRGIYGNFITREATPRQSTPSQTHGALMVSTFSPVQLHVYNSRGNHTGPLPDGTIEEGIPGSSFEETGEQQFITVPEGDTYKVITEGTEEGNLTLWQTDFDPTGLPLRILEWDAIPVQPGSLNTLVTQFGAQGPALSIDNNGDGVVDMEKPVTNQYAGGVGPMLLADLNEDGQVDDADVAIVEASLGSTRGDETYNPVADVDRNGIVNQRDVDWVRGVMPADLELTLVASKPTLSVDETGTLTVKLVNKGPATATDVVVSGILNTNIPLDVFFIDHVFVSTGEYSRDPNNKNKFIWVIKALNPGSEATLNIQGRVTQQGSLTSSAEVTSSDQIDPDSSPSNGIFSEDDQSSITIDVVEYVTAKAVSDTLEKEKGDKTTILASFKNYPNPFNTSTVISFELANPSKVELIIYDKDGRLITRLIDKVMSAGLHNTTWQPKNLSTGVYIAQIRAGKFIKRQKIMLVK